MSGLGSLIVGLFGLAHDAGAFSGNKSEITVDFMGDKLWLYPENLQHLHENLVPFVMQKVNEDAHYFEQLRKDFYGDLYQPPAEGSGFIGGDYENDFEERRKMKKQHKYFAREIPFSDFQAVIDEDLNALLEGKEVNDSNKKARTNVTKRGDDKPYNEHPSPYEMSEEDRDKLQDRIDKSKVLAKEQNERKKKEEDERWMKFATGSGYGGSRMIPVLDFADIFKKALPNYQTKMNELKDLIATKNRGEENYFKKYEEVQDREYQKLYKEREDEEEETKKQLDEQDKTHEQKIEDANKKKEDFDKAVIANAEKRLQTQDRDAQAVSGIKTCKSNTKTRDQIEHEAYQEEKQRAKDAEEAEAKNLPPDTSRLPNRRATLERKKMGLGEPKKINKRAEVVKEIMVKKGLSMIEASKYVKQHNLY